MDHDGASDPWRAVVEASTDGLWLIDAAGRTAWANDRLAVILGREPGSMLGFPAREAFGEGDAARFDRHLSMLARATRGRDNLPLVLRRVDGAEVPALVSYSPARDESGRLLGWLHRVAPYAGSLSTPPAPAPPPPTPGASSVTSAMLAEAEEIAGIGSWSWDVPQDRVWWSDQLYRIYGLQRGDYDATYEGFLAFVHPDDRERVRRVVEETFAGVREEFDFDARVVRASGEVRWIHGRGRVTRDAGGAPVRMGGTTQDVTELHRSQEAADEATRRLRLLQQMATAANSAGTLAQAITMAADGLPDHTGWSPVAVYAVATENGPLVRLDDLPVTAAAPDPALAEQARHSARPSSTASPGLPGHSLVAVPVSTGGRVVVVVEVLADENPLDEDSHRLIAQVSALMGVVAEREQTAAQLASARDEAMEASRMKSEFLATMSHEIRTPMNGVIGLNELLLRTTLDDHQRRLAEGVQTAGLSLLAIINDILDLSKIEAGKLELEDVDFEVRSIFEQTAAVLSGPAHEKGLELVVACHPDVPGYLRGDPTRLGQVLTNLGSNAVKFTESGEVAIQARIEHRDQHGVVLRVDVSDTGVGIPPAAQATLFDAFTQADLSTTRRHGGTGLGLAICQQLVEAMGGQILVDSEEGRGSTFSFTARLANTPDAPRRLGAGAEPLRGQRVLVVDDNETNRFILTEQLSAWHVEPVAVATPAECLATLREAARSARPFTIALLDMVLPRLDGLELARVIKADPALEGIALVLLSSDQGVGGRTAREAGISTTLSKPVRHAELYDALVTASGQAPEPRPPRRLVVPSLDLRVLVVEDNPVNQLVATGLLEALGVAVDVADDGQGAVEALRGDHPYALVLMDCRMPGLDGFDATRAVRAGEAGAPGGRRVPIIAMTASALEGERERCLAAGMDDFLTKPVEPGQLEEVVQRWTRPEPAQPAPSSQPAQESVEASAAPTPASGPGSAQGSAQGSAPGPVSGAALPIDPDLVDVDDARRMVLDELVKDGQSFFDRTARSFISRIDGQVADITSEVRAGNVHGAFTASHLVKGSALNLGLPRVAEAARQLEAHAHDGSLREADAMLRTLRAEVERAVARLRELVP